MAEELSRLTRKRGGLKRRLTEFSKFIDEKENFINSSVEHELSRIEIKNIEARLQRTLTVIEEFYEVQDQIDELNLKTEGYNPEIEITGFERQYYFETSRATVFLEQLGSRDTAPSFPNAVSSSVSEINVKDNIKLPTITLPKFSGNYTKWLEFKDTFEALVHKSAALSQVQKFYYLRASLEGDAAKIVAAIETTADNYEEAWKALCERYQNKRLLLQNHMRALFTLPEIKKGSPVQLREALNNLSSNLHALKILGQPIEAWDSIVIYLTSSKFDDSLALEWESQIKGDEIPTLEDLKTFLTKKACVLETINFAKEASKPMKQNVNPYFQKGRVSAVAMATTNITCYFCKENHSIYQCIKFSSLTVDNRIKEARNLKLCLNCLRPGHSANNCQSGGCRKCRNKHNSLLHLRDKGEAEGNTEVACTAQCINQALCLLSTARINVFGEMGMMRTARVLLDSGSQSNFVTEKLVKELNLQVEAINMKIAGVSNYETFIRGRCSIRFNSRHSDYAGEVACLILPEITGILPPYKINEKDLNLPENMQMADPGFGTPGAIDMLLGSGNFWDIISNKKMFLGKGKPIIQESKLGWIVAGNMDYKGVALNNISASCIIPKKSDINEQLRKFWEIEEGATSPIKSETDLFCESHFKENVQRNKDGRFSVSIPFLQPVEMLGNSENVAQKRFFSLERKLHSNANLKEQYVKFMREYIELQHMARVEPGSLKIGAHYFLPHHCVQNASSLTTKLRVVFDASCPTSTGYSLNNIQGVGPIIQNDLLNILIRFRQYPIAISADITKMYRQILIKEPDRRFHQILWRESPSKPLETYRLNTVTYGTASASFLAIRCLNQLAQENLLTSPNAADTIINDFYVDDLLTGVDTIEEGIVLVDQITEILKQGCLELRKWISNDSRVTKGVNRNENLSTLNLGENESTKTLGLHWDPKHDTLIYKINTKQEREVTKRVMLSIIGQIFDPLGLLGAHIIRAKLILQRLWLEGVDWDDKISELLRNQWDSFYEEIKLLENLTIPRSIISRANGTQLQLHGYADASERAYGACIYLRSFGDSGCVSNLIISKSRVAPIKTQTIPRLELCAAQLLADLMAKVTNSLRVNFERIFLWSDSTIVLAWIRTSPHMLKIFVASRVKRIQELTTNAEWRYVPSAENPADMLSRGISARELLKAGLWWHGPHYLSKSEEHWPMNPDASAELLPELKVEQGCYAGLRVEAENMVNRFSSLKRAKRVTAYCFRFRKNCALPIEERQVGPLGTAELNHALHALIKNVQKECYSNEIKQLNNEKPLNSSSSLLSLKPFLDGENLLRVGGRLEFSKLTSSQKNPIILPPKANLTKLIFAHTHVQLGHAGPAQTLFEVRQQFWPIHGRKLAKSIVHQCVRCFRAYPKAKMPIMGALPAPRVTPSWPFEVTGVDYAGPFLLKRHKGRGAKIIKGYLAIFICFATKATHIEVVSDLSTEAFIASLKRFVARRGKPREMHSDNGTNFVGASNELKAVIENLKKDEESLSGYLGNEGITWRFIPASAPHFGGLWESAVKRTKFHLRRIFANVSFTFEELCTVTCQIEAILNSRPLSPLSDHPDDLDPLTPSHFLVGRALTSIPETNLSSIATNRLSSFQHLQQLTQDFWSRWTKEYIPELQPRGKWAHSNKNQFRVGDLAVIKEDNQPPLCWAMGRIILAHPGKDGETRVVTLQTKRGLMKRPVAKVFPLPNQGVDNQ